MAALEAIPADDWSRTWAAARTIMLRRTSKKVKDVVETLLLPAVVHLSRDFWNDFRNGTREEIILSSQQALRLLPECWGSAQLRHLNLRHNCLEPGGAAAFAGVIGQCAALEDVGAREHPPN